MKGRKEQFSKLKMLYFKLCSIFQLKLSRRQRYISPESFLFQFYQCFIISQNLILVNFLFFLLEYLYLSPSDNNKKKVLWICFRFICHFNKEPDLVYQICIERKN